MDLLKSIFSPKVATPANKEKPMSLSPSTPNGISKPLFTNNQKGGKRKSLKRRNKKTYKAKRK